MYLGDRLIANSQADGFREMVCTSLQFLNKDSIGIRPQQREVLLHILSGQDTFINLLTEIWDVPGLQAGTALLR